MGLGHPGMHTAAPDHMASASTVFNHQPYDHSRLSLKLCGFLVQEYGRASYVLNGVPGPRAQFLCLHAAYLAGEKKKECVLHHVSVHGVTGRSGDARQAIWGESATERDMPPSLCVSVCSGRIAWRRPVRSADPSMKPPQTRTSRYAILMGW